jgi:WD40 repeat protein
MRLRKKLREIEKLEVQEAPLQANQRQKLAKKPELLKELAALGPTAIQVVVITPAGNMLADIQMEHSSTAADLLKVLVDKGIATLYRHKLVCKHRALKPDEELQLDEVEDGPLELTLVAIASTHLVTGTEDGNVSLWDLGLGSSSRMILEGHAHGVTCTEFSPDGRMLLTASADGTAKLWSVESCECLHTLAGFSAGVPIYTADFSPDGKHVVLSQRFGDMHGERPGVTVWRTSDGKRMQSLYVDGGMVGHGAKWSPAGDLIATCSGEFNGWVFCARTGAPLQYLDHGMSGDCFDASFSPDGRFVRTVAGSNVFVRRAADMWTSNIRHVDIWTSDINRIDETKNAPVIFQAQGFVAISSQGLCARTDQGAHSMVSIVDLNNSKCTEVTKFQVSSEVVSLEFGPSGSELIVLAKGEPPSLWAVADGSYLRAFGEHESSLAIWSPDGRSVATFYGYHKIMLWCIQDGAHLNTFEETGAMTCASVW